MQHNKMSEIEDRLFSVFGDLFSMEHARALEISVRARFALANHYADVAAVCKNSDEAEIALKQLLTMQGELNDLISGLNEFFAAQKMH